jgi:D-alanyl-D-alanine carboxypeptidase (penicillin-binding protein 5/6)
VTAALPASVKVPGAAPQLPWPSTGQGAVGAMGAGEFATSGTITPAPIASLAKMMTALVVLADHPLGPGQDGPSVTITPADVAGYRSALAQGESTVAVTAGEQLTERQMLEALLVGSDDNMANVLAAWDAGSVQAFVAKMNAEAQRLGLARTHYADPSGLSPSTASTAPEQLVVAEDAVGNATIAGISAQRSTQLPVAGNVANFNSLVGTDGIVGIKTGNTDAAGGCIAIAATATVSGQPATMVGVLLGVRGASMLTAAVQAGKAIADATRAGMTSLTVVRAGSPGALVRAPWASPVPADSAATVSLVAWPGQTVSTTLHPRHLTGGVSARTPVGTLTVSLGRTRDRVQVRTRTDFPGAPPTWKLRRI